VSAQGQYSPRSSHEKPALQLAFTGVDANSSSKWGKVPQQDHEEWSMCSFLENDPKIGKKKRTSLFTNQTHPATKQAESSKGRKEDLETT